ncbi:MAG: CoA-binding protein [Prolixibacteraceae bacterium]|jgi:predicted CoA-binding protein|nr:CoA-binding protein [Prolixibacteraceae bacterium]
MNPLIEQFVSSKRIAVVGMSRSGKKFGNMAAKELKAKGYEIYPVHPDAVEIDGFTCSPNLQSLTGKIDGVWISIPPKNVSPVLEEAAQIGLKNIWLQQGAWSAEVQQTIDQLNLPVVSKKCIMMYAPPVKSVHKFHRTIVGIFGGL